MAGITIRPQPMISVVTAVYNGAEYLPALIESVQNQTYQHVEHVIIDDGSDDGGATQRVLESYSHLRWWKRENKGQYTTQNEGISAAKGDILVVIAADDVFSSKYVFQTVVDYFEARPEGEVVYGHTLRMDANGSHLPDLEINRPPSQWLIKQISYVQHCSLFVTRPFIINNRLFFDPTFKYAGDWDWIIRLFKMSRKLGYIPKPFSVIRMHQNQTSRTSTTRSIAAEHQRVSKTHRGNYALHVFFSHLINWRGMSLLGVHTIRKQGVSVFLTRFSSWLKKR